MDIARGQARDEGDAVRDAVLHVCAGVDEKEDHCVVGIRTEVARRTWPFGENQTAREN